MPQKKEQQILNGIPAAPGICIGQAYLVDKRTLDVVEKYPIDRSNISNEAGRFRKAIKKSEKEIVSLIRSTQGDTTQQNYILEAHLAVLKDKMFFGSTVDTIKKDRVNAEWALKMTVDRLKYVFSKIDDDYIRNRSADIIHVYERVLRNLVGGKDKGIDRINKRVILVAHDLSPAEASQIQLEWVQGFITDKGGRTSHTGIVARTLQLTAVTGLENVTGQVRTEDVIIVDGIAGVVVLNPDENTLFEYTEARERFEARLIEIARDSHLPASTEDGARVYVNGNIELLEEVVSVKDKGADGIGLYRTEFLYLNRRELPSEQELFENYKQAVEIMAGKPVTIRTLDVAGDKVAKGLMGAHEDNPALGLRAIRFCMRHTDVFLTQLRAILRAAAFGHVKLLFPMISNVEEIIAVRRIVKETLEQLEKQGLVSKINIEVGIMVEVPSVAVMADMFAQYVDFFSIGTNDLIQYSLAVDRGNRHVAHLFQTLHPAVIRMIKHVSDVAKETGVRLAICGEMAADPLNTPLLIGMGFDELSMNPQAVPEIKNVIRSLDKGKCVSLVEEALKKQTAEQIADLILEKFGDKVSRHPFGANNGIKRPASQINKEGE